MKNDILSEDLSAHAQLLKFLCAILPCREFLLDERWQLLKLGGELFTRCRRQAIGVTERANYRGWWDDRIWYRPMGCSCWTRRGNAKRRVCGRRHERWKQEAEAKNNLLINYKGLHIGAGDWRGYSAI